MGLGAPTTVDADGRLLASNNLPTLAGLHLDQELGRRLALPVRVFNDARCFALGEWWLGPEHGAASFCGLTLGTGLGLGTVVDGRIRAARTVPPARSSPHPIAAAPSKTP